MEQRVQYSYLTALFLALLSRTWSVNSVPSSVNCSWTFIEQPLSHFIASPTDSITFFKQRLCIYTKYWKGNVGSPVFLYAGNESPVEVYINNTGLIWLLAKKQGALIVFAEHRYFGGSIPNLKMVPNCMSYLTVDEVLQDYVAVCNKIRLDWGDGPIIAFGGSYGGMLSAWLRIAHPGSVSGAVSSSAPLRGFPLHSERALLEGSANVITYALSSRSAKPIQCAINLKASYVLLTVIGSHSRGRKVLSEQLQLCSPLTDVNAVERFLSYLQDPLFNLAEGSYPFATDYITRALAGSSRKLPAWALQGLCSELSADFGAELSGDVEAVKFSVSMGSLHIAVDWDEVVASPSYSEKDVMLSGALRLLRRVVDGVQVWYNATGRSGSTCLDWDSTGASTSTDHKTHRRGMRSDPVVHASGQESSECTVAPEGLSFATAWEILVCNSGLNLVNWRARGVGRDVYWPPNVPKNYSLSSVVVGSLAYCSEFAAMGLAGVSQARDEWAMAIEARYGGSRLKTASNVVFTNGDLDPWAAAGVEVQDSSGQEMSSYLIEDGGHHLDLFWPTDDDPESVRFVRKLLEQHVGRWVSQAA